MLGINLALLCVVSTLQHLLKSILMQGTQPCWHWMAVVTAWILMDLQDFCLNE